MCLHIWPVVLGLVAIAFSVFYGLKAVDIFGVDHANKPAAWKFHQFWLNFAGSLAGWLMLWVAVRRVCSVVGSAEHALKMSDFILFLVAFVGITGFLPLSVVSFIQGIRDIAVRVWGAARHTGRDEDKTLPSAPANR
ncbi:MAG: hypothetical protein DMF42_04415 [Verrucomicrobia bacterium]|nr:MAG: hypothetical protein DMF42_04415 [Verrucomicrobiota bacterium]